MPTSAPRGAGAYGLRRFVPLGLLPLAPVPLHAAGRVLATGRRWLGWVQPGCLRHALQEGSVAWRGELFLVLAGNELGEAGRGPQERARPGRYGVGGAAVRCEAYGWASHGCYVMRRPRCSGGGGCDTAGGGGVPSRAACLRRRVGGARRAASRSGRRYCAGSPLRIGPVAGSAFHRAGQLSFLAGTCHPSPLSRPVRRFGHGYGRYWPAQVSGRCTTRAATSSSSFPPL